MKIAMAILLVLCLCACDLSQTANQDNQTIPQDSNTSATEETTESIPVPYEDMLIEKIKIYDPKEKAIEALGSVRADDGNGVLTFYDKDIFGEQFTPKVYIKDGYVKRYEYILRGDSEAKSDVVYKSLIDNFTRIYGSPYENNDDECIWYFADGTKLQVSISHFNMPFWHSVGIGYSIA